MTTLELLKKQVKDSRETFEGTVKDVTQEMLDVHPGGKALPLGATYAHLVFSEDAIIHGMLQGKTPLFATEWKDKTGADQPMPAMDDKWSEANEAWSNSVKITLDQLREYSTAVHAATDNFMESLKEEDLDREIDLGSWGKRTLLDLLSNFIIGHTDSLAGEVSVLKGLQGKTGYPF